MTSDLMLEIEDLEVSFGKTNVFKSLNLKCYRGETIVITGSNGCGKTTLLNVLNGLYPLTSGIINICGKRVTRTWNPVVAFRVGIRRSFQIPKNWESLNLVENLELTSANHHKSFIDDIEAILPNLVSLESPTKLSFGQRRLLEILRIVYSDQWQLVLLDEPLAGLDQHSVKNMKILAKRLAKTDAAMLIVDHEPERWPAEFRIVNMDSIS